MAQTTNPPVNYKTATDNYSAPAHTAGYLDSSGNFVPTSVSNPLPVAASVAGTFNAAAEANWAKRKAEIAAAEDHLAKAEAKAAARAKRMAAAMAEAD